MIEKEALSDPQALASAFTGALSHFGAMSYENDKYILLVTGSLPETSGRKQKKKALWALVNTIVSTLAEYILFTLSGVYAKEITDKELFRENVFFDRQSIYEAVKENVISDIRRDLRRKKKNWFTVLRRRILENMLESPVFAVSSFIRFRVQDFKEYVFLHARSALSGVREEIKYIETVSLLRDMAERQMPGSGSVRIDVEKDRFCLSDENGEPLDKELFRAQSIEGIKNEDLLLGVLIAAAPEKITVSADDEFFRSDLFSTITNIFGSRVAIDYARNNKKNFFLNENEHNR